MKRFQDMIELYIESEIRKTAHRTETLKRGVLEDFAFFIDTIKEKVWTIQDLTEKDTKEYYGYLRNFEKPGRARERKIQILNHFMDFAVKEKWILERPWKELSKKETQTQGRIKIGKEKRERLVKYLENLQADGFFEKRDKAMLLLLLSHDLRYTEISNLNLEDVKESRLLVKTPVRWRTREIELSNSESQALYGYLFTRLKLASSVVETKDEGPLAPDRGVLFIGYKRRRISPGMVKQILKDYVLLLEEE